MSLFGDIILDLGPLCMGRHIFYSGLTYFCFFCEYAILDSPNTCGVFFLGHAELFPTAVTSFGNMQWDSISFRCYSKYIHDVQRAGQKIFIVIRIHLQQIPRTQVSVWFVSHGVQTSDSESSSHIRSPRWAEAQLQIQRHQIRLQQRWAWQLFESGFFSGHEQTNKWHITNQKIRTQCVGKMRIHMYILELNKGELFCGRLHLINMKWN